MIPSRRSTLALVVVASTSLFPFILAADDKPIGKQEFMAAFSGPDSTAAGAAIDRLDPDKPEGYDLLKKVLEAGTWYLRSKAAERLAKTGNDKNVKDMIERLSEKGEKSPLVRQGMIIAIARMKDPKYLPDLQKTLNDKDGRVRRAAVQQIKFAAKDKSSIDALIARWKDEKDPIVANFIRQTLEDMTQQFLGAKQEDWASWWQEHKDTFKLAESDEDQKKAAKEAAESDAAKKAEEEGKKLSEGTTRSKDVDLTFKARGKGMPVIVLPHYAVAKEMFIPFFIEIEKICKVCYMDIPKLDTFKNLEKSGPKGDVFYPLDSLVGAFEDFRKEQKVDKVVILACGMDAWIAMRYATKYPKNVAALVFVAPISSTQEYGKATDRMANQGKANNDVELQHYAMTRAKNSQTGETPHDDYHKKNNVPKPEGEDEALDRRKFSIFFGDQQDTLLDFLYPDAWHHPGSAAIPEFKPETETPGPPSLVMSGKRSLFTSEDDCARVAKQYGSLLVTFDRSADFPFIEESEKFTLELRKFLVKYVPKPKAEKAGGK